MAQGFIEIETPLLWTPTPEGAREFAIPSRLQNGSFYVLSQTPQIAKQLGMVGGSDRYFQIARCTHAEDLRADRQFEFTQLDIEASFVSETDVSEFVTDAISGSGGGDRAVALKSSITWQEALERFGTDKPDLRFGMELVELVKALSATEFKAFQQAVRAINLAGGAGLGRADSTPSSPEPRTGAEGLVSMRAVRTAAVTDRQARRSLGHRAAIVHARPKRRSATSSSLSPTSCSSPCSVLGQLQVAIGRPR